MKKNALRGKLAYLIDGNNFIGYTNRAALNAAESRPRLVLKLTKFQSIVKSRVILVFDGPPGSFIDPSDKNKKSFKIIFPKINQTADEVIKEIIERETDLRRFFVVTDDREIKTFARAKGAKLLSCRDFKLKLREALKKYREKAEMKKIESTLTPLELQHMAEIFEKKK